MDRTIIGPWKAEEKELCEMLYKKLQGLTLLYMPTEELKKCISEDMFLKSNPHAFFNVMHFLFRILDIQEFKKRFYWPINDKRSEANFRSSTVDYLNYLSEKHQLGWTSIKSYLFVSPGGMKFISFLLEFVSFVIQEIIKSKEKQLGVVGEEEKRDVKQMRRHNEFFKEYASEYIREVDSQIKILRGNILFIKEQINKIAEETGVNFSDLISENFHLKFESDNRNIFENNLKKPKNQLISLEDPLLKTNEIMENFLTKDTVIKFDEQAIEKALQTIQLLINQSYPTKVSKINEIVRFDMKREMPMHTMIATFNVIYPTIEKWMLKVEQKIKSNDFVSIELRRIFVEMAETENQIMDFQKTLKANDCRGSKNQENLYNTPVRGQFGSHSRYQNKLLLKFISTPPIKNDVLGENVISKTRLALIDDFKHKNVDDLNYSVVLNSARKFKHEKHNNDIINNSKIINPKQLLRTINKDHTQIKQTSQNLSVKWRDRPNIFKSDDKQIDFITPTKNKDADRSLVINSDILGQSPFTPLNSNNLTRITQSQLEDSNSTLIYVKKSTAVMKVENALYNILNLSTSPSGRLESLVTINEKRLSLQNEQELNQTDSPAAQNLKNVKNIDNLPEKIFPFNISGLEEEEEESISNISDTVLQDLIL